MSQTDDLAEVAFPQGGFSLYGVLADLGAGRAAVQLGVPPHLQPTMKAGVPTSLIAIHDGCVVAASASVRGFSQGELSLEVTEEPRNLGADFANSVRCDEPVLFRSVGGHGGAAWHDGYLSSVGVGGAMLCCAAREALPGPLEVRFTLPLMPGMDAPISAPRDRLSAAGRGRCAPPVDVGNGSLQVRANITSAAQGEPGQVQIELVFCQPTSVARIQLARFVEWNLAAG